MSQIMEAIIHADIDSNACDMAVDYADSVKDIQKQDLINNQCVRHARCNMSKIKGS